MVRLPLQTLAVCVLTATASVTTALAGQPPKQDPNEFVEIGGYVTQLWLFWAAPIAGAVLGGLVYRALRSDEAS